MSDLTSFWFETQEIMANSLGMFPGPEMANYYAENCNRCRKKLAMKPNGEHEDEWHRGYCTSCSGAMDAADSE